MDGPEIKIKDKETDVKNKENPNLLQVDSIVVDTTHNGVSEQDGNETDVKNKEDPNLLQCDSIVVDTTHNGVSEHDDSTSEGKFSRNTSKDRNLYIK